MKTNKYFLSIILFISISPAFAQFPGAEYVIEIDKATGDWTRTGPPIPGITYVIPGQQAYNQNTGMYVFPGYDSGPITLYSINVSNDSLVNRPIVDYYNEFHFDNKSNTLYAFHITANHLSLGSVDLATGAFSPVVNSFPIGTTVLATAYDDIHRNYIFISDEQFPILYSINTESGKIISNPIIPLGGQILYLVYDNSHKTLYGLFYNQGSYSLVNIDPNTGQFKTIGQPYNPGQITARLSCTIDEVNQQFIYSYNLNGYAGVGQPGQYFALTLDLSTGNAVHNVLLPFTPSTNYNDFFNLQYDNISGKLYAIHWEAQILLPPLITVVNVDTTDVQNGQITVSWVPPFNSNPLQYPVSFSYSLLRSQNSSPNHNLEVVYPGSITDTTFVDAGLNTIYPNDYFYRVIAYTNVGTHVDTSKIAPTIKLKASSVSKNIQLTWTIPWANRTFEYHRVYRGTKAGSNRLSDLTLIDSISNAANYLPSHADSLHFTYIDSGQYNHTRLSDTVTYFYAVTTRGNYFDEPRNYPLHNVSEIISLTPYFNVTPCTPILAITSIDCSTYDVCPGEGASPTSYSNTIKWKKPQAGSGCSSDIKTYHIYASTPEGQQFLRIGQVSNDTTFVHSGLFSLAMCYKVSAVDFSGHESPLSESFCFDNCPNYVLPNVFTPNGDNCNALFSAYSARNLGPDGETPCNSESSVWKMNCARFVSAVNFKVFNRWGEEVYTYQSDDTHSIYIDWNGKDKSGKDLDAGNYYYLADVVFDVTDINKRNKTLKGWVVIIR